VRLSAPANFGAPLPSDGDAKGSKPTIWHDSPPGCAARQRSRTGQYMEKETMPKFAHSTLHRHARAQPSEGRRRYARLCRGHPRLALRQSKAWMAGTSPAMTNDGFWRNEPERCSKWRFGETTPSSRSGETNPRGLRSGILAKRTRGLRRPNGLENVQNDRKIRVLSSRQWRRLRRVATTVLWLRLPYLRDCRRKGMPPGDKHRRNIMGSGP